MGCQNYSIIHATIKAFRDAYTIHLNGLCIAIQQSLIHVMDYMHENLKII